MQNLKQRLINSDNIFVVVLLNLVGAAFFAVTDQELSAPVVTALFFSAVMLIGSYGVEGFIAKIRHGLTPAIVDPILKSKRFWVYVSGAIATVLNYYYPVDYAANVEGLQLGFYEIIGALVVIGIGSIGFDDWAEAWREYGPTETIKKQNLRLEHAQPAAPPDTLSADG